MCTSVHMHLSSHVTCWDAVGSRFCVPLGRDLLSERLNSPLHWGRALWEWEGRRVVSVQCVCHGMKMRGAEESVKFMCGWVSVFTCQLGSKLWGPKLCVWVVWLCLPPGRKRRRRADLEKKVWDISLRSGQAIKGR